jgi:hypothetical protein
MNMRDYPTLHLDINSSKGTALSLLSAFHSHSRVFTKSKTHILSMFYGKYVLTCKLCFRERLEHSEKMEMRVVPENQVP